MDQILYKKSTESVIERLKLFYDRKLTDQVLVNYQLPSPALEEFGRNNPAGYVEYPDPVERVRFWDTYQKEKILVEDDSIPSAYLSEFDQGLYGALIGGEMQFLSDPAWGWISSMVKPMYDNLADFLPPPVEESHPWFQKYMHQLNVFSELSKDKFGISHFILIDSLNFVFELVGATKTYLSFFENPEKVQEVIDFAFDLNVKVQEAFFENTPSYMGGTFSNLAQWLPGRIVSESVDPFHMTSVEDYEQWGKQNIEKMFSHFDGGVLHLHSNGRHLLNAVSQLDGLKALYLLDEKDNPPAFEQLPELQKQSGDLPLVVAVEEDLFEDHLKRNRLPGGVLYVVNSKKSVDEVNRLMERVRRYRI
ncbi:MAG: hypothetical protein ABFS28_09545 [Bacteroidota bacterium]